MFSRIIKKGDFVLSSGVRSAYTYDYASLTDTMSAAYCEMLSCKLDAWQTKHGRFNVVAGIETEGIRIGYQISRTLGLPFHIVPHKQVDFAQLEIPKYSADTHWLIIDDIVTTGSSFLRAVNYLDVEEKPETITFACMIKRSLANMDYSAVHGDPAKEQLMVPDERYDFIDKRLVHLYAEPE